MEISKKKFCILLWKILFEVYRLQKKKKQKCELGAAVLHGEITIKKKAIPMLTCM